MNRAEILYLIPYLGSLLLCVGVLYYAWHHRDVPSVRAYTWYALGQTLWIFGFLVELLSMELGNKIFWDGFQWSAGLIILIAFPVFAVQYSTFEPKHPRRMFWLSLIVPVVFALLLMTDSLHHWIYLNPSLIASKPFPELTYDYTPIVYVYGIYSYLILLWGMALLIRRFFQAHGLYRAQMAVIIIGLFIPIGGTILSLANIQFAPQRDGAPFTAALGNLIVAWGLIRFRLFEIIPIARDIVMENMLDLVVVLDANNIVVDANPAAVFALHQKPSQVIGKPAEEVFAQLPELLERFNETENVNTEATIQVFGKTFHYEVKSTILEDKQQRYLGRVFVSRDISDRIELQTELQSLNEELEERIKERTEELYKSAERYRAVVDHQTEFIMRWKPDRTRTFVNEAYCRYFGLTHEQAMKVDFMTLIIEEDRQIAQENISRLEAGIVDTATEIHRVIKADGSIGWNEWIDTAIRNEDGNVIEFQSVGRDITERKHAEETILKQLAFEELMTGILTQFATCPHDEIDTRIQEALHKIAVFMEVERAYMVIIDPEDRKTWSITHEWNALHVSPFLLERQYISLGRFPWIENQVLKGLVTRINTLDDYPPEASAILKQHQKDGTKSVLNVPVRDSESLISGCVVAHTFYNSKTWTADDITHLRIVGDAVANLLERKRAEENLLKAYDTTLEGWAKALELRDKETEDHSRRVTELTVNLAQTLGIDGEELTHIRRGAILHDIGKMGIPDEILLKRGPLTDSERKVVEQHPLRSYKLLSPISFLEKALEIPYCHHERWDGTGYPRGLKGEDIPLSARIFSVIDVWDALLSDRPYSKAWPRDKTIRYLKDQAGKHFDPRIVEVFLDLVDQGTI